MQLSETLWSDDAARLFATVAALDDDTAIVAAVEAVVKAQLRPRRRRSARSARGTARNDSAKKVEAVPTGSASEFASWSGAASTA